MPHQHTKIFLDSASPKDTRQILDLLGYLDGQTTNPSLIVKILDEGKKISEAEMLDFYKQNIQQISTLIPDGSVSVEVYADENTSIEDIYNQAVEMNSWIPNAHVKFPTIPKALEAAEKFLSEGGKANFTLVFSQQQAAAIAALANKVGAKTGQIFISPFIGRLDDTGQNGLDLIKNILRMYSQAGSPVEVLAASIRDLGHLAACFQMQADIVTLPMNTLEQWQTGGELPSPKDRAHLEPIAFENIDPGQNWRKYDLSHPLTTKGLAKFAQDWKQNLV